MFFGLIVPLIIFAVLLLMTPRDHDRNTAHYLKRIAHAIICCPLSFWIGGVFSDMSGYDYEAALPGVICLIVGVVFLVRIFWFILALIVFKVKGE